MENNDNCECFVNGFVLVIVFFIQFNAFIDEKCFLPKWKNNGKMFVEKILANQQYRSYMQDRIREILFKVNKVLLIKQRKK